jgi:1,2-diacylglycerol 3-beta-glucosyltransferase
LIARQLLGALALFLIALGLAYFGIVMSRGVMVARRARRGPPPSHRPSSDVRDFSVFVLIPCLDEERVVGNTIRSLLEHFTGDDGIGRVGTDQPPTRATIDATIVVIDDASSDATGQAAREVGGHRVMVCRREFPHAQLGKGDGLNTGLLCVLGEVNRRRLNPANVIVCVMDADGQVTDGGFDVVLQMFAEDSRLGAVQLPVRIRNRDRLITRIQDLEFWVLSAVSQLARSRTGTVSLGGNGQFSRVTALLSVGPKPWSESLTEDLDLAISMSLRGWRLGTTTRAHVHQQGVDTYRRLLRQRTRWYQGTIMCSARVPEIWRNPYLSNAAALEMCLYLLLPVLLVLPWSIVFHLVIADTLRKVLQPSSYTVFGTGGLARILTLLLWYIVSFLPNIALGYLYHRRDRTVGRTRSFLLAHALIPYNYIAYAATWAALWRILRGRRGWTKTTRSIEPMGART